MYSTLVKSVAIFILATLTLGPLDVAAQSVSEEALESAISSVLATSMVATAPNQLGLNEWTLQVDESSSSRSLGCLYPEQPSLGCCLAYRTVRCVTELQFPDLALEHVYGDERLIFYNTAEEWLQGSSMTPEHFCSFVNCLVESHPEELLSSECIQLVDENLMAFKVAQGACQF